MLGMPTQLLTAAARIKDHTVKYRPAEQIDSEHKACHIPTKQP